MQVHFGKSTALAAAILCGLSSPVQAQRATPLEPVVVTANRVELPARDALASVTVLTRADIQSSQAPDLLDLLSRQAGIDVARTGGPGQASTVFLRGGNSSHTLVLIDGVRANAATQGVLDLAHLPLAQVERIEIVRGPRAALWGSDAIGGVIQIFTRDPAQGFFQAQLGGDGRAGVAAGAGVQSGVGKLGISAGSDHFRGFSATNPDVAFGYDPDADGYRNDNLSLRGQTRIGEQTLAISGLVTDADVEFDDGRTAALNRLFSLSVTGALGNRWTHHLGLGRSSEDLDTPAYGSKFGSARNSLDWVHDLRLDPRHELAVGVNWSREEGYSSEFGSGYERSRRNAAAFASWRGRFGAHSLQASARHDDNSQFDSADTASVAWGWQLGRQWRLRAGWGQGFRAPNFSELYYPGYFGFYAGNEALRPERSVSSELGLDWQLSPAQHLGVSLHQSRIRDLIAFEGELLGAININRARIDGAELDYRFERGPFDLQANATWLDARDGQSGKALLRRADRKANVSAGYRFDNGARIAVSGSALSERPDLGALGERIELPGYARVDLNATLPLAAGWTLEASVENIGDRDYSLVNGYNTPGRNLLLNLRWNAAPGRNR